MRIIIAGGRNFSNYELLKTSCIKIIKGLEFPNNPNNHTIVSGGANGADKLGERFAKESGYELRVFPADWDKNGKSAGFIRNKEMAEFAKEDSDYSMLIAFWDGKSKGTDNMIELGKKMLNAVKIVRY